MQEKGRRKMTNKKKELVHLRALSFDEIAEVIRRFEECGYSLQNLEPESGHWLLTEFCRYGIVNPDLHEIANPEDPEEEWAEVFELLPVNTIIELGEAIMSMSMEEKG